MKKKAINIKTEGGKHLGAVAWEIGQYLFYVNGKGKEWMGQGTKLAEFALSQPQACYAALTFRLKQRWTSAIFSENSV